VQTLRKHNVIDKKLFSIVWEDISLRFYKETKHISGKAESSEWCTGSKRSGIGWTKAAILKLRGLRKGIDIGICLVP
jgi:hypothetical protein